MTKVLAGVELLAYPEAAEALDLTPQTVREYVRLGILHPVKLPRDKRKYLLREELDWYDVRRRNGGEETYPNPYPELYAQLDAAGVLAPPLAYSSATQAQILAQLDAALHAASASQAPRAPGAPGTQGAPPPAPGSAASSTPPAALDMAAMFREGAGAGWLGALGLLLFVLFALYVGRRPDAGKVEQLRANPDAGRISTALRQAAELLDAA